MNERCGRCGEPATTTYASDMLIWTHGGGTPYCERCVVELQLDHALERASQIDKLQARLSDLGGRAERLICGYTYISYERRPGEWDFRNIYCILVKGHEGEHSEQPPLPATAD